MCNSEAKVSVYKINYKTLLSFEFTGESVPLVRIIARACAAIGLKITSELKHQNPITISSLFSPFTTENDIK